MNNAFLSALLSTAFSFAGSEIDKLLPYVEKVLEEIPSDLLNADPTEAFKVTFENAKAAIIADAANLGPDFVVTVEGLIGSVAKGLLAKL